MRSTDVRQIVQCDTVVKADTLTRQGQGQGQESWIVLKVLTGLTSYGESANQVLGRVCPSSVKSKPLLQRMASALTFSKRSPVHRDAPSSPNRHQCGLIAAAVVLFKHAPRACDAIFGSAAQKATGTDELAS